VSGRPSIARRLSALVLLSTGVVMVVGLTSLSVVSVRSFRQSLVDATDRTANLVAAYSVAELAFGARAESAETLARLERSEVVVAATLYDADGEIFAAYQRPDRSAGGPLPVRLDPPDPEATRAIGRDAIDVVLPVEHGGQRMGTVLVRSSTAPLQAHLRTLILALALIVVTLLALSLMLIAAIRRSFVAPILRLAGVAERISRDEDYSLRAPPEGYQEPSTLSDGINAMLAAIEDRQRRQKAAERAQRRDAKRLQRVQELQAGILGGDDAEATVAAARRGLDELLPPGYTDAVTFDGGGEPLGGLTSEISEETATAVRDIAGVVEVAFQRQQLAEQIAAHTQELERRVEERTAQLAAREAAYRLVAMNADGLVVIDRDRHIRFANPAARTLLGFDEDSTPGVRFPVPLAPDVTRTFPLPGRGDERNLEATTVEVDWEGEPCLLASLRDITEQQQVERELFQSQKMAVVGQLAGGIAHDFNNLLMGIYGCVDLALEQPDLGPLAARFVRDIRGAAERASHLTGKLLDFSRRRDRVPQPVEVGDFLLSIEETLGRLLGEGIELTIRVRDGEAWVVADTTELEQLVINLAANSRDAVGPIGKVAITLEGGDDPSQVRLSVSDDGPGIPTEVLPRVFEPFFTTKPIGEGTGMGLATVYGIVRRIGGTVEAGNARGGGAQFTMMLPRVDRPIDREEELVEPSDPQDSLNAETVLVVDDNDLIRELIVKGLSMQGYEVLAAPGGPRALEICRDANGDIDLLITDLLMPGMDGVELVDTMKERYDDLRYLYMTGFADDVLASRGLDIAKVNLLHKPFRIAALLEKVRAALDA